MSAGSANHLFWLGLLMAACPFAAQSKGTAVDPFYRVGPANITCVIEAAKRQGVPANVMLAIASVEGGANGQFVRNANGSFDMGHFQLNTIHFRESGVFTRVGIKREDAAWRGCYNAELAAWMVRKHLNAPGSQSYWVRVANYHSATPQFNARYRAKLVPLAERWGRWLQANYQTTTKVYH